MNGFLASEEILKGNAFHVFQTFEKSVHVDVLFHDITDLRPDFIVRNRAIDDVIVVDVVCILVLAIGKDERSPISGIAIEMQESQSPIAQMSLVEFVALDYTPEDVEYIISAVKDVVSYLRSFSPVWRDLQSGKTSFIL